MVYHFSFLVDQIVMTPKCKTANSTTLIIERKTKVTLNNDGLTHIAGGDHKGIVINKTAQTGKCLEVWLGSNLSLAISFLNM